MSLHIVIKLYPIVYLKSDNHPVAQEQRIHDPPLNTKDVTPFLPFI